jgi:hypothetical protein
MRSVNDLHFYILVRTQARVQTLPKLKSAIVTQHLLGTVAFSVRTRSDAFNAFKGKPNTELDHRSGSTYSPNLELDHGPVHEKSGSNHGSEPNLCITSLIVAK